MLSNKVHACCGLTLVSFQGYHPALSLAVREQELFHHVNDIKVGYIILTARYPWDLLVLLSVLAETTPLERTACSSSLTKAEKRSLRRVELEVEVWLELEEWLAEIGRVLSVAGVVSIESPGQSVHSHIPRQNLEKGQAIQEVEL